MVVLIKYFKLSGYQFAQNNIQENLQEGKTDKPQHHLAAHVNSHTTHGIIGNEGGGIRRRAVNIFVFTP